MIKLIKITILLACLVVTTFASNETKSEILIDEHKEVHEFQRIVVKPNLTSIIENELKLQNKKFRFNSINLNSNNTLKYNIIHETENTFYLVTMVDHPSKLNVTFNYKVNPKRTLKENYGFSIVPFNGEDFNSSDVRFIEMEFKNLKFSEFLAKESKLLHFFDDVLWSDNIIVIGIENRGSSNLVVKLARSGAFSKGVKLFKQQLCDKNGGDLLDKFNNEVQLEFVSCSMFKADKSKPLKLSNFTSTSLDFDIDILISSSLNLNINYILFLIVTIFQILSLI